jgi:hypothetical protein
MKLLAVSLHPFHRTDPEEVGAIKQPCALYVNRAADLANSVVIMLVVLEHLVVLCEDELVGDVFDISIYSPLSISNQHLLNVF